MDLFIELLQVTVGYRSRLSRVPSTEEWKYLYSLSKQQALQGVVYAGVSCLPAEQRPDDLLMLKWYGMSEKVRLQNNKINKACVMLSRSLHQDGKRHVIMKGQGVALLYPNPLLRVSGDIDVWLEGTRQETIDYMCAHATVDSVTDHNVGAALQDNTTVEVHFVPGILYAPLKYRILRRFFNGVADGEFANVVPFYGDGCSVPVSTLEFNRVYLMVHMFNHYIGLGIGLRQMMDYFYVLKQGFTEVEREASVSVLKSLRLTRFAGAVMYVLQTVFGLRDEECLVTADVKEGKVLLNEIFLCGNFGQYDKRIKQGRLTLVQRGVRLIKRNAKFLWTYPEYVLAAPFYKVWMTLNLLRYRKYVTKK